jgi:hypothetical protein
MQFVDGPSLTNRALELLGRSNYELRESNCYKRDCFLWPGADGHVFPRPDMTEPLPVRSFYYTSIAGDDEIRAEACENLWSLGFEPHVFRKDQSVTGAKSVGVALTKDMLSHAFRGNYEIAVLVSGDGAYVPLLEEVKRLGKRVHVHFPARHASPELKLTADVFEDITPMILRWGFKSENSALSNAFNSR